MVELNNEQLRRLEWLLKRFDVHSMSLEQEGDAVLVTLSDESGQNITLTIDTDGRAHNGG